MNAMLARRLVEQQIARNPTEIQITRMLKVDDGAGGTIRQTVTLPAQTVRLFMSSLGQTKQSTTEAAQVQVQRWGMLTRWDAEVQPGDTFTIGSRPFRVVDVDPVRTGGEVVSLHADLEEVS